MDNDDDDDFGKSLKNFDPPVEYPNDLRTSTKAEFTTLGKQYKKDKDGCRGLFSGCIFWLGFLGLLSFMFERIF